MQHFAPYHKQFGTQGSLLTKSFSKLFFLSCVLMIAMAPKMVSAQAGQLDPSFNSADHGITTLEGADNDVRSIAIQPDGKIIVGGVFTSFNGSAANRISRINADGSSDATFNVGGSGADGNVYKVLLQADGKIILAGKFNNYNGVSANKIVRLNADGSRDAGFSVGTGFNDSVNVVRLQADGKVLVGGNFTAYNGVASIFAVRLNTNGTKDALFTGAGVTSTVNDLAVQVDGKILVGTPTAVARLTTTGATDPTFNVGGSGAAGDVQAIAIQADNKILIGGGFSSYNGGAGYLVRVNADGSVDGSFSAPVYYPRVRVITLQADAKILVGFGDYLERFPDYEGKKINRLNANGTVDVTYNYEFDTNNLNQNIFAIAIQADGKILSAESTKWQVTFRTAGNAEAFAAAKNIRIRRYKSDGSDDTNFAVSSSATGSARKILATALQPDGKILVGGYFYSFNGQVTNNLVRLNSDGSKDATFNIGSGFNGAVNAIAIQADGKIVVGGYFSRYNGQSYSHIIRLNTNGSVDPGFSHDFGTWAWVNSLSVQPDGKILAGGEIDGVFVRLNTDGTTDNTFTSIISTAQIFNLPQVYSISLQADGKIIAGGHFDRAGGFVTNVVRLNTNGTRDISFNGTNLTPGGDVVTVGANNDVNAIALQPDGKVLVGGIFTAYTTAIGGTTVANRLMRLTNTGEIDPTFNPGGAGANGSVNTVSVLPDGKILIGGSFSSYNGTSVSNLIRVDANGLLDTDFNFGGAGANGAIYSLSLEPSASRFYIAGDFTSYNGNGKNRIARIFNGDAGGAGDCTVGNITGPNRACQYITAGTNAVYQIAAPTGSTITWSVSNSTTMSIVSGQGTGQVNVHFQNSFVSGGVYAHVLNAACSLNVTRSLTVSKALPSAPGGITASNSSICSVLGTPNTITYSINKVSSASSYIWTAQAGTTTITHPNGAGVNDTTITVAFAAGFTNSAITVQSVNDCGTSSVRSLNVTRNNPGMPAMISGPSYVCDYLLSAATIAAAYSVTLVAGVTYIWTVPAGATALTGQGTNSISFFYPAGFTTGTVSVTASNGCGTSTARSMSVKASVAGTPGAITTTNISDCPNRQYTYSIAAIPVNATSVNWVVPVGATIVSGQGTTSITVSYTSGAITGYVSVKASNTCGTSTVRKIAVSLAACPPPAPFAKGKVTTPAAAAYTNQAIAKTTLELPVQGMEIKVFPNPSVSDFNLQVLTSGKEKINVRIFDVAGRFINEYTMSSNETSKLGAALKTGTFIIEVRQGNNVKTTRIIKF